MTSQDPAFTKEETDLFNAFITAYTQHMHHMMQMDDCEQKLGTLNEKYNNIVRAQYTELPTITRKVVLNRPEGIYVLIIDCEKDDDTTFYALTVERLDGIVDNGAG